MENELVLVKFKVGGNLRFLSHSEMMRVFQRASIRAGVKIAHSQGFNPRPQLSLPLPKSVGVESDEELLCIRVKDDLLSFDADKFRTALSAKLPQGCEILSVDVADVKTSIYPLSAVYVFVVKQDIAVEELETLIKHLLESKTLNIERKMDDIGSIRRLDVRPFLENIKLNGRNIVAECKISPAGSIRPEEILKLLKVNPDMLASPIKRTNIKWQITKKLSQNRCPDHERATIYRGEPKGEGADL